MGAPRLLVAAAVAAVSWGCGFHGQRADWNDVLPPQEPAPLLSDGSSKVQYDQVFEYRLGNGDSIDIQVAGHKEFSGPAGVDERGRIAVPNTSSIIEVDGLTLAEVEGRVSQTVAPYIVGSPDVQVGLTESKSKYYYCLGGVWRPGLYSMGAGVIKLREAVAAAGLFREYRGDDTRVGVITPDPVKPTYVIVNVRDIFKGEEKYDVVIKPGDIICVQNKIIYDLDSFLYTMFRETENVATTHKAAEFWQDAAKGEIGNFTYPRQGITIIY